jgi:DNA-directed RNA polymerase subunit RPC12/RpoP
MLMPDQHIRLAGYLLDSCSDKILRCLEEDTREPGFRCSACRSHLRVKNPTPDRKAVVERALECFRREYLEQHKIVELAQQARERREEMGLGLL